MPLVAVSRNFSGLVFVLAIVGWLTITGFVYLCWWMEQTDEEILERKRELLEESRAYSYAQTHVRVFKAYDWAKEESNA